MKMKAEHFTELKAMVMSSHLLGALMDYRERRLPDKRYRWDCLWSTDSQWRNSWFSDVYEYLNDDHIDTALKKITGTK